MFARVLGAIICCVTFATAAWSAPPAVRLTTHRAKVCEAPCSRGAVVFIHGITGSKETWGNPDTELYWPKMLVNDSTLADSLDIYQLDYESYKFSGPAALAIEEGIEKHLDKLLLEKKYQKVIFIAHSLGGIFARTYLLHVKLKYGHVALNRFRLVVTLGTPNEGSDLANLAQWASQNQQLRVLKPIAVNDFQQLINKSFDEIKLKHEPCATLRSFAAYEESPVTGVGIVVTKQSATRDADDSIGFPRNHLQLPKPTSVNPVDPVYKWATDLVRACMINRADVCPVYQAVSATACPSGDFRVRNRN